MNLPSTTQSPLTALEITERKQIILRITSLRSLGISQLEALLVLHLLVDPRPITGLTLSILTGYSRRSLQVALGDLKHMGLGRRTDEGWSLTPLGLTIFTQIGRETSRIVKGQLKGYSSALKDKLRVLPTAFVVRPFKGVG